MSGDHVAFVFIPVDTDRPLEEWQLAVPQDKDAQIGCLTERLRVHFKQATQAQSGVSDADQRATFKEQLLKQMPDGAQMTDAMLNVMLQMDSLVDSIPLVVNSKDAEFIGVNLYVDDKGVAKGLPTNRRASAIAQACGKMLDVKGDAFIARVLDNDDDFTRMDFKLSEVSENAAWVQLAKQQSARNAGVPEAPESIRKMLSASTLPGKAPVRLTRMCTAENCMTKATMRCSGCKQVYYCSAACQKADWKNHKQFCKKK